jgi:hypothetical protein
VVPVQVIFSNAQSSRWIIIDYRSPLAHLPGPHQPVQDIVDDGQLGEDDECTNYTQIDPTHRHGHPRRRQEAQQKALKLLQVFLSDACEAAKKYQFSN